MLYLIRHGQTDWNLENKIQGTFDIPLNQNGIAQAKDIAEYFESGNFDIKRIISSDLLRAKQTANTIGRQLNVNVEYDSRLREYDFGKFEGKNATELSKTALATFIQTPQSINAELFTDAFARITNIINSLDYNINTILVSHGGIMHFAIHYFNDGQNFNLQKFIDTLYSTHIGNTSVFRVATPNSRIERLR